MSFIKQIILSFNPDNFHPKNRGCHVLLMLYVGLRLTHSEPTFEPLSILSMEKASNLL